MKDSIHGKTIRWRYTDGPTAGKEFEHRFGKDGTVEWRMDGKPAGADSHAKYEVEQVRDDVCAVAYLAPSGWELTSVLDLQAGTVVSFASNEKQMIVQHGTFELV